MKTVIHKSKRPSQTLVYETCLGFWDPPKLMVGILEIWQKNVTSTSEFGGLWEKKTICAWFLSLDSGILKAGRSLWPSPCGVQWNGKQARFTGSMSASLYQQRSVASSAHLGTTFYQFKIINTAQLSWRYLMSVSWAPILCQALC